MLPLREVQFRWPSPLPRRYPFDIKALQGINVLPLENAVTLFTGDNGSGKSTLLESLAAAMDLNAEGGSKNAAYASSHTNTELAEALKLVWNRKIGGGFYFRAETLFQYASYLENIGDEFDAYGGRSLHGRSHGESFLSLFSHRLNPSRPGLYLFDEPESALSVTGQLAFLRLMHQWAESLVVQVVIATHSPILLAYPKAAIWSFDTTPLSRTTYENTAPYQITRAFLDAPGRYLTQLFNDE
jgi:predicted ATPase